MDYLLICATAFLASGLTFFSGFGLGTLLVPVFALFFPIDIAIALTAVVHFLNNLFKLLLVGRHARFLVVLKFGLPSIVAAFAGAALLAIISEWEPLASYTLGDRLFYITPVKLIVALLIIFFSLFDLVPQLMKLSFNPKYLPVGGLLSGFFGGLSGNQGALRSAFLIKAGLAKEAFIATGVVIACLIDVTRISVYAKLIFSAEQSINYTLLAAATLAAFAGALLGNALLKKVTIQALQMIVAIMLILVALGLATGLI